jgi:hypothetical protein
MSKAPRPMKRTHGVSITPRRQQATPYPPPQTPSKPQRTTQSDNASRQTTIQAMGFKRGFSCLDSDDEEEEEEVVEPVKGVNVKKEFREAKEEKKERKSLVPHSPDSKPVSSNCLSICSSSRIRPLEHLEEHQEPCPPSEYWHQNR